MAGFEFDWACFSGLSLLVLFRVVVVSCWHCGLPVIGWRGRLSLDLLCGYLVMFAVDALGFALGVIHLV